MHKQADIITHTRLIPAHTQLYPTQTESQTSADNSEPIMYCVSLMLRGKWSAVICVGKNEAFFHPQLEQ